MPKQSAGLLFFRRKGDALEVFLVHPGGPFWAKKDRGAWSIPKGERGPGDDPLETARREFEEETGFSASGPFLHLGSVRQPGGKIVEAWAAEGDCDPSKLRSNSFSMEWPPRSGRRREFPEADRGEWFGPEEARRKILKGQLPLLDRLEAMVNPPGPPA